jgi:hypothetical protein
MDAYHEVLIKLLEATEGKVTKSVDFRDLVKKTGLYGNYAGIFKYLSQEGWIAEDQKADFVRITIWGITEAKKSLAAQGGQLVSKKTSENAAKCVSIAKEFISTLENLAKDASKDNLKRAENKFAEMELAFNLAKNDVD